MWMSLPDLKNLPLSIPIFAQFPTQQYTIFERKASNYFDQIGCFLQEFALNTPNLCNLGYFVLRYTKFRENAP